MNSPKAVLTLKFTKGVSAIIYCGNDGPKAFPPDAGRLDSGILSRTRLAMRYVDHETCGFGPAIDPMAKAVVRVRVSYLLSQWVQAPITDWREADT